MTHYKYVPEVVLPYLVIVGLRLPVLAFRLGDGLACVCVYICVFVCELSRQLFDAEP